MKLPILASPRCEESSFYLIQSFTLVQVFNDRGKLVREHMEFDPRGSSVVRNVGLVAAEAREPGEDG